MEVVQSQKTGFVTISFKHQSPYIAKEWTELVVNEINNSTNEFKNENLTINVKDYYFSNVIARSSKTMVECNNSKLNLKSTGTEG